MEVGADLDVASLTELLPARPLRSYPALLSTEADALAWARAGAISGSLVVADYQASPRGRGGLPWETSQGEGLGFSLVLRPRLSAEREGWLYSVVSAALLDTLSVDERDIVVRWPDELRCDGRVAAFGVTSEVDQVGVKWAVVNVLVERPVTPRAELLARIVPAIEAAVDRDPGAILDRLRSCSETLGREVRARLVPMGPTGVQVEGTAVDLLPDGALLIETERGSRIGVLPHRLGVLDDLEDPPS